MKKLEQSKIDEIIKEYNNNLTDNEISKKVGCSVSTVLRIRQRYNLKTNYKKEKRRFCKEETLTNRQKEILCGTLLGDSSLQYAKNSLTPIFTSSHGPEQEKYAFLLAKELNGICTKRERYDKRNKKRYISFNVRTKSRKEYIELYKLLYINNSKQIFEKFLENFSELSLAYLYMDDGYTSHKTAFICTDCFSETSCDILINFLKKKFDLQFRKNIHENKIRLRLSFEDRIKFCNIVEPHMLEELKYKLPPKEKKLSNIDSHKKNTKEFIEIAKKIFNDKYDFSKVKYVNNKTEVCLIEKKTGKEVWKKPKNMLKTKKIKNFT